MIPPSAPSRRRAVVGSLLLVLFGMLSSCGVVEEKRLAQLMNEKGFGSRATGDATREDYVGGLDTIQFLFAKEELALPGRERLIELTAAQPVGLDGTLYVPYVGPIYVLGKTEAELSALVQRQLTAVFSSPIEVQARIIQSRKFFYSAGEVGNKGRILLTPDMTFFDAMFTVRWTNFANLGHVYLIRPDAETPLVIDVNFREMVTTGFTAMNVPMREHDIIYVPPTLLGVIGRLLQRVSEPIGLAVRTLFGLAQVKTSYEVVTGQRDSLRFYRF